MSTWIDAQSDKSVTDAIENLRQAADTGNTAAQAALTHSHGDDRFALWLWLVDRRVYRMTGALSMWDLADWLMRDAFDAGTSPRDAAREALENDDLGAEYLAELEVQ